VTGEQRGQTGATRYSRVHGRNVYIYLYILLYEQFFTGITIIFA